MTDSLGRCHAQALAKALCANEPSILTTYGYKRAISGNLTLVVGNARCVKGYMDAHPSSIADRDAPSKKLLLADDDHSACAAVGLFFESEQFEVKTVGDGIKALHLCTTWHPDAALLDIDMPGASGYEVAREIRHLERQGHRMLLVAVTGEMPSDKVAGRCRAAGFDLHVAKPTDLKALLHFVVQSIAQ